MPYTAGQSRGEKEPGQRLNDIYRKVIYMKTSDYAALISIKDGIEQAVKADTAMKHANISFDFNPMSGF